MGGLLGGGGGSSVSVTSPATQNIQRALDPIERSALQAQLTEFQTLSPLRQALASFSSGMVTPGTGQPTTRPTDISGLTFAAGAPAVPGQTVQVLSDLSGGTVPITTGGTPAGAPTVTGAGGQKFLVSGNVVFDPNTGMPIARVNAAGTGLDPIQQQIPGQPATPPLVSALQGLQRLTPEEMALAGATGQVGTGQASALQQAIQQMLGTGQGTGAAISSLIPLLTGAAGGTTGQVGQLSNLLQGSAAGTRAGIQGAGGALAGAAGGTANLVDAFTQLLRGSAAGTGADVNRFGGALTGAAAGTAGGTSALQQALLQAAGGTGAGVGQLIPGMLGTAGAPLDTDVVLGPLRREFTETIAPNIRSGAVRAGAVGGSREEELFNRAIGTFGQRAAEGLAGQELARRGQSTAATQAALQDILSSGGLTQSALATALQGGLGAGGLMQSALGTALQGALQGGGLEQTALQAGLQGTLQSGGLTQSALATALQSFLQGGGLEQSALQTGLQGALGAGGLTQSALATALQSVLHGGQLGLTSEALASGLIPQVGAAQLAGPQAQAALALRGLGLQQESALLPLQLALQAQSGIPLTGSPITGQSGQTTTTTPGGFQQGGGGAGGVLGSILGALSLFSLFR